MRACGWRWRWRAASHLPVAWRRRWVRCASSVCVCQRRRYVMSLRPGRRRTRSCSRARALGSEASLRASGAPRPNRACGVGCDSSRADSAMSRHYCHSSLSSGSLRSRRLPLLEVVPTCGTLTQTDRGQTGIFSVCLFVLTFFSFLCFSTFCQITEITSCAALSPIQRQKGERQREN